MHTKFERLLSKSVTTLEVMTYDLVVHTGPDGGGIYKTVLLSTTRPCTIESWQPRRTPSPTIGEEGMGVILADMGRIGAKNVGERAY